MTEDDDLDGLAAEYALGTLSLAERREVETRRRREAALDQAVKAWERRLGPLGERTPEIAPPADLFPRIADRLRGAGRTSGAEVIPMPGTRRAATWPVSTVAGLSIAACLLLGIVWVVLLSGPAAPTLLVAELHRSAGSAADEGAGAKGAPAFKVTLDLKERSMVVSPVSLRPTPRRSFELWLMGGSGTAPKSLGVVSHAAPTRVPWREDYPTSGLTEDSLAVSLEPEGGSPAGAPTGPILFVGKLAAANP